MSKNRNKRGSPKVPGDELVFFIFLENGNCPVVFTTILDKQKIGQKYGNVLQ
jgi:hypothetical protein